MLIKYAITGLLVATIPQARVIFCEKQYKSAKWKKNCLKSNIRVKLSVSLCSDQ